MKRDAMKGIGVVLIIVGSLLMLHGYQESQSFAGRLNDFFGNTGIDQGFRLDMLCGFILAIVGGGLFTMSRQDS